MNVQTSNSTQIAASLEATDHAIANFDTLTPAQRQAAFLSALRMVSENERHDTFGQAAAIKFAREEYPLTAANS